MPMRADRWRTTPVLVAVTLVIGSTCALAGAVYLKDGYALHGFVKREMELISDSATGQVVPIAKANNCFLIDDGVRYAVFSNKQVASTDPDLDIRQGQIVFLMPRPSQPRTKLPAAGYTNPPSPFDDKWQRTVAIRTPNGPGKIKQRITRITPHGVRVESFDYDWVENYLTSEFPRETILQLLHSHPDIVKNPKDFEQQFRLFRFCTQAGWTVAADDELKRLRQQFPDEKTKLDTAQQQYRQFMVQKTWEEADAAAKAGRHSRAEELINQVPLSDLAGALQADAANLRTKYEGLRKRLELVRHLITFCSGGDKAKPELTAALATISKELNYDSLDRAESFAAIARQAEQASQAGQQPKNSNEELQAALITGWVFGPTAVEVSVSNALAAWQLRDQLLAYQRQHVTANRKQLAEAMSNHLKFSLSEIAQAISLLPPADASEMEEPQAVASAVNRQTKLVWAKHGSFQYRLLVPAEYHAIRQYPVIMVLPHSGESTAQAMAAWEELATRHGYILASVDWGTVKSKYEYSEAEQAAALDCLRDMKRFLQIDSDRVFLTGFGEGANMAFDVGLSHPDLFAGVMPFNGRPRWYSSMWYWRNAQYLPFYIVCGELTNEVRTWDASIFDLWANHGYMSLLVIYRGRVFENYTGEVIHAFDWMERKRRAPGFPELGRNPNMSYQGEEFQTFRETDNRFYWVTVDRMDPKLVLTEFMKKPENDKYSAAVQAVIKDNNQILVNTRGVKRLSLWLGRIKDQDAGVREMVDFSKPIQVLLNTPSATGPAQQVTPKLETMLEDFYERCDRNRLFMARLEFNLK